MNQVGSQQQPPYGVQPHQQVVTFTPAQNGQYTTLYTASGTPIQIVNAPASDGTYHGYKTGAARILGFIQIVCGIVIFISQIVVTSLHSPGFEGMSGYWGPAVFILAGAFGVQSAKTKSTCAVVSTMVLSIIAAIFSVGPLTQGSIGLVLQETCHTTYEGGYYDYRCYYTSRARTAMAFHAFILIFGVTEGIAAIIASAYCCHGCCCNTRPGVVLGQHSGLGVGQVVTSGGVQVAAVQYQAPQGQFYNSPSGPVSPVTPVQPGPYPGLPGQPGPYPGQPGQYPGQPGQYPSPQGAPGPLPTYSNSSPPPQYQEKA